MKSWLNHPKMVAILRQCGRVPLGGARLGRIGFDE